MCNCLETSIKQIKEKYPKWKDKEVDDFFYSDCGINFTTGKMIYGMGIDIRFKGQKKLGHTMLNISHCPLCGQEFKSDKEG